MKPWLLAVLLAGLSGCASPSSVEEVPKTGFSLPSSHVEEIPPAEIDHSFEANGTAWLPPSDGPDRKRTTLPVPVNVSGMVVDVRLRLGNVFFGAEVPATLANVQAQLVNPGGVIVSQGEMHASVRTQHFGVTGELSGAWELVLLSYGGSGDDAHGDYVEYDIQVTAG